MNYELAKQLKDSGFRVTVNCIQGPPPDYETVSVPTLSELIEACGDRLQALVQLDNPVMKWTAEYEHGVFHGDTPDVAIAKLWLELNKK